jgi:hypothetical protein
MGRAVRTRSVRGAFARIHGARALLASLAVAACTHTFGPGAAPGPPRVMGPEVVRWSAGGPHVLEVAIENPTPRAIDLPDPTRRALVDVHGEGRAASCQLRPDGAPVPHVTVLPGTSFAVRLDLTQACRDLPPGGYSYALRLDLPPLLDGARSDPLASASGAIVVEDEARSVLVPRAPDAVAPPGTAAPPTPAIPRAPDPVVGPGAASAPASASDACVDRELGRLGLNAYGDPPGTAYPVVPPVRPSERIQRVLARYPEIRTACGVPRLQ